MRFSTPQGQFGQWFSREVIGPKKEQVTAAVAGAAEGLKLEIRQSINQAGLGTRLGNAVRSQVFPKARGKASLEAAGLVYVRPGKGDRSGAVEIVQAFDRGVTIRRADGKYLAIPTRAVPRERGRRLTPAEVEARYGRKLILREGEKPGHLLLFLSMTRYRTVKGARRAKVRDVLMFTLVRQTKIGKRTDHAALAKKWVARIPDLIDAQG